MNLIFAGTPEFALPALTSLINSDHHISAVLTQPDRPKGRGRQYQPSPVKQLALDHHLPVLQPATLKDPALQSTLAAMQPDAIIVVAYGMMIPPALLTLPRFGCLNIHPSTLPRWRGSTPIQHALLHGEENTGVTIMELDKGMDTGPILQHVPYAILPSDNSQSLHDTLGQLGAEALLSTLTQLDQGTLVATPQNHDQATYTRKISKADGQINWQQSAHDIVNQVRAYHPWPVAYCALHDSTLRIWDASVLNQTTTAAPGTVINFSPAGLDVAAGTDIVRITTVQLPGARKIAVATLAKTQQHWVTPQQTVLQ